MPDFTLRFANRGTSTQDWTIQHLDQFTLDPNWVLEATITLHNDRTFNVAVDTPSPHFAAASLAYTAATDSWTLQSNTPNEFQLAVGGGLVTLRCFLSDTAGAEDRAEAEELRYSPREPARDAA